MRLGGEIKFVDGLTASERGQMFALMNRYYAGVTIGGFERDLREKHAVALVRSAADDAVVGFSTIRVDRIAIADRRVSVLFSGDTVVDRSARSANPLARLVLQHGLALDEQTPDPVFWFLISKGHRTYRYLPLLFRSFHPNVEAATDPFAVELVNRYASHRYGRAFDAAMGVIVASAAGCRLAEDEAPITESRRLDPHVAFFESRNPGHASGDELCCVARVCPSNLTGAGRRVAEVASVAA